MEPELGLEYYRIGFDVRILSRQLRDNLASASILQP